MKKLLLSLLITFSFISYSQNGLQFVDGDYVKIENSTIPNMFDNQFSIEFVVKKEQNYFQNQTLIKCYNDLTSQGLQIYIKPNNRLAIKFNLQEFTIPNFIIDNTCHQVSIVRNNNRFSFYVDGEMKGDQFFLGISPYFLLYQPSVFIGGNNISVFGFKGEMDEVRFFNSIITQTQINTYLFSPIPQSQQTNLVAYYNFDELGQEVYDVSTNNNNGLIGNGISTDSNDPVRKLSECVAVSNPDNTNFCDAIKYESQPYLEFENTIINGFDEENNPFKYLYDAYGNKYSLKNIEIETTINNNSRVVFPTCSSGYFTLHFTAGSGMESLTDPIHQQRRDVLCQVFNDLSNMIASPLSTNGEKVQILIRDINAFGNSNGVLGKGSGFYVVPNAPTSIIGGLIDNQIWKTINNGQDSYANLAFPLSTSSTSGNYYHGMMGINFNSSLLWNINTAITSIPSNQFDLYSVVLHEAMHMLGFSSLIDINGNSKLGNNNPYYSRYDKYLLGDTNSNLIFNTGACNLMYDYGFVGNLLNLEPSCSTLNPQNQSHDCNNIIKYNGNFTVPVYNPGCYSEGSSLSHFEDQCYINSATGIPYGNDNYFVMSNALQIGDVKRNLQPEERNTLCEIGYTLNNLNGIVCNNVQVAGANDGLDNLGTYLFSGAANTPIFISNILDNDFNATGFECLQDVYDNTSVFSVTSGTSITTIDFTTANPGIHLLRYIPINGTNKGNITYIYVFVFANINNCGTLSLCNDLVINGDFEQFVGNSVPLGIGQFNRVCNWSSANATTPDYFHSGGTTTNDVPSNMFGNEDDNVLGNNAYAGMWVINRGNLWYETIRTRLSTPLESNTTYTLTFDVSKADGNGTTITPEDELNFQAYLSNNGTPATGSGTIPINPSGILLQNSQPSTQTVGWETITFTFTTGSTAGQEFLYIGAINNPIITDNLPLGGNPPTSPANQTECYYYIDNVSLVPLIENPEFNLPDSICIQNSIEDLSLFLGVLPPNGQFSGDGVELNAGVYSFNATAAGSGSHIITYTYTNNVGCIITLEDTIDVIWLCQPPYISQVYNGGGKSKAIEVKNASNTQNITTGQLYLVYYEGNGAPANLTTPTAFIDLATGGDIMANGVKVFRSPALSNPAYIVPTATPFPTFQGYDGIYDVVIISTSNGANAYNDRIDILGDNTVQNVLSKQYTKEDYRSLVRMSCTPMGFPRIDYDEQDWVGFNRFGISTTGTYDDSFEVAQGTLTNGELGRHFSEVLTFRASETWDEINILDQTPQIDESLPDRSRNLLFQQNYQTNAFGSFEGCSMLVESFKIVNVASADYAKIQTFVEVQDDAQFIVEDGGSLVMVRDCYYTPAEGVNYGCGTELVNLGGDGIMTATKQTVAISGPYDYVYLSSPLSNNTANPTLNQIFNFGSGTGMFNPTRFYLFQNHQFCDIYKRFSTIVGDTDGYDDNYDDYDPSDTALEQNALMFPGRGYATWPPVPATAGDYNYTITFTGEMNNGIVTVPVFKNNSLSGRNANLIGNPYPSAIDLDKFFAENNTIIEPIAYIWTRVTTPDDPNSTYQGPNGLNYTAANYSVYTQDMSLNTENNAVFAGGSILASGQSFFVRAYKDFSGFANAPIAAEVAPVTPATIHPQEEIITAGNIQFRNYMRTTEPNITFSRMTSDSANQTNTNPITGDKLWVNLADANDFTAQLGIYFKPSGNAGYLPTEDAVTIAGRKYNFYTQSTTEDLIIDVQDAFETSKVIPLGITNLTGQNQQFTISIPQKGGVFDSQEVYLFDSITQTYHNLSNGNFTFTTNDAIIENRFSLVFSQNNVTLAQRNMIDNLTISVLNDTLTITSANKKITKVQVFDIYTPNTSGLKIAERTKVYTKEVVIPVANQFKILNVIIELEDGTIIRKKIMK